MKQLQPVIWSKGTYLAPQHLQLQDRFIEDTLSFQLGALNFRAWGLTELAIDQAALVENSFVISRAAGIFPDGLLFSIPDCDEAPGAKLLADFLPPGQDSLDLFLAIPEQRQRGLNVSLGQRDLGTRYSATLRLLRDENTGLGEKPVQLARKNFRVLAQGENLEGNSLLRIANVQRTGTGTLSLNPQFIPPLLQVSASDYLCGLARQVVELLTAKSSELAGARRQKNLSLADFSAADIASFWLLYTINSHFPLFHHLFSIKKSHPEELYSAMVSLAGCLTTFSTTIHLQDLPPYDHESPGPCFTRLAELLRTLLETVVPSNFVSLPLKLVQPSVYATAIADDRYLRDTRMFLAIGAEVSPADLIRKVPQLLKVGSATHLDQLIRQALPGMTLTHLPSPPGAIPMKLQYQYFSLSQSGVAWESVQRARNLGVYVPGDFPNAQLELLILLPQAR